MLSRIPNGLASKAIDAEPPPTLPFMQMHVAVTKIIAIVLKNFVVPQGRGLGPHTTRKGARTGISGPGFSLVPSPTLLGRGPGTSRIGLWSDVHLLNFLCNTLFPESLSVAITKPPAQVVCRLPAAAI